MQMTGAKMSICGCQVIAW